MFCFKIILNRCIGFVFVFICGSRWLGFSMVDFGFLGVLVGFWDVLFWFGICL